MSGIAIRVDGGVNVGMGHVVRCLALIEPLRRQLGLAPDDCVFYLRDLPAGVNAVRQTGYPTVVLPVDAAATDAVAAIRSQQPDRLIVDLYDIPTEDVITYRDSVTCPLACITDLDLVDRPADLLVNGFVGLGPGEQQQDPQGRQKLLGAAYKLLRPPFADCPAHPIAERVRRVLVTTGGYDLTGITLLAAQALAGCDRMLQVDFVLGPAYEQEAELQDQLEQFPHAVRVLHNVSEMAPLLQQADLVITAGGDTVYELAACGAPAVVLCHVAHQTLTAEAFAAREAVVNLGRTESVGPQLLQQTIATLDADPQQRQALSRNARALVDGRGTERVAAAIAALH